MLRAAGCDWGCGYQLANRGTTRERCKRGLAIAISSIRCATRSWRLVDLETSGGSEWPVVFPLTVYYSRNRFLADNAMVVRAGAMLRGGHSDEYARWRPNRMLYVLRQSAADFERRIAVLAFPKRPILL